MTHPGRYAVVLMVAAVMMTSILVSGRSAWTQEATAVRTITVEEVSSAKDEGSGLITIEQVEEARMMTADRLYTLLVLWGMIILVIVLIRLQVRDDEKLYQEGYYSKDLE